MGKIKIAVAIILFFWCRSSVTIVKGGGTGQIVSSENVKIDSAITEIRMVLPDEIQRLEDNRDRKIKSMEDDIALLRIRISKLESEFYK